MEILDWVQSTWNKLKAYSPFGQEDGESNMAHGGYSGYKPNTAKHRAMRDTQRQQTVNQEPVQADPMATGMNWGYQQDPAQTAGFGGYTGTQQVPYQTTAPYQQTMDYNAAMNNGFGNGQGATGYQNVDPMQNGQNWQEQQWMDPNMNGYGGQQTMGGYGNTVPFPQADQTSYYPPQTDIPQPQAAPQTAEMNNISYMPGNFVGEDGTAYSHCERVATINNVSMCYRIVEFMRNKESVIVSTEQITDEAENQRCLDLLYGAAFAMKCSFTRIAAKSIYLVAPTSVMVIPYESVRRMSDQDLNARWPEQQEPRHDRFDRYADHRRYDNDRYAPRNPGYGRQQEGYSFGRRDYYAQDEYNSPYNYNAVGYGR